jgi:hypothetical protein
MSAFDDNFEEMASPELFGEFGDSVTYTLKFGGASATIVAIVTPLEFEQIAFSDTDQNVVKRLRAQIQNHAVLGIENPKRGDQITWRGITYSVVSRPSESGKIHIVEADRIEDVAKMTNRMRS